MEKVCVIGLGRVGLPFSLSLAEAGFIVHGLDISQSLIDSLSSGKMPFAEKHCQEYLSRYVGNKFLPTTDESTIKGCSYIIVTLGTPVDDHLNPDYAQIGSVLKILAKNIVSGMTIIFRSTVMPGTTEYVKDTIEKQTSLACGKDFFLAYCPERIAEGNSIEEIKEIPQIIGGMTDSCSRKAIALFEKISPECLVTDAKSAELAKLFTNMYRYINFAISNEFAIIAHEHGKEIHEITRLVNTNYKRGGLPPPGFAAGPCLYKDGFFILNSIPYAELITSSWRINEGLPGYLIQKIKETYGPIKGKKAVILGLSFKKNHDDTRNSLSFKIKKSLAMEQCIVQLHDPFIHGFDGPAKNLLADAEIIFIATNHDEYKELVKERLVGLAKEGCIVCDIWNITGENKLIYKLNKENA